MNEGKLNDAIQLLNDAIATDNQNDSLYFMRGKLFWKQGDRTGAMNDYASAVKLNPDSPAAIALEQAHAVAQFFNPDLLNP